MKESERFYTFWWVCIPVRFMVGVLTLILSLSHASAALYAVGVYTALVAVGLATMAALTLAGWKTKGGLGGRVWWNRARIVHCALWAACAALSFAHVRGGGILILIDAFVACIFGLLHFGYGVDI